MERTIDRTNYRRSARNGTSIDYRIIEDDNKKNNVNRRFKLTNMLLNQIIVSLLIIIGVLTAQYFDISSVTEWISKNMSGGYSITELYSIIKNSFSNNNSYLIYSLNSGEQLSGEYSGDEYNIISGDYESGEVIQSGETISAVEGVNQMSDDVNIIKQNYSIQVPLYGIITSNFGSRESDNPIVSSYHTGLDIAADSGTEIYAAHSGKVIMAKSFSSYGNCVMIENGNLVTVYAHCLSINVHEGEEISKGKSIAKVGMTGNATGPHLHFEIRYEGRFVDPEMLLDF